MANTVGAKEYSVRVRARSMTRGSFIKSLLAIYAAPSLIAELGVSEKLPVTTYRKKKAFWCKFHSELYEDKEQLNHYISYVFMKNGFDPNKDFEYKIGWQNEDFVNDLMTCRITQYVD